MGAPVAGSADCEPDEHSSAIDRGRQRGDSEKRCGAANALAAAVSAALHAEGFQVLSAPCPIDATAHARLHAGALYLRQIDAATLLLVADTALAEARRR